MNRIKILIFHHSDAWGGGGISLMVTAGSLNKKYDVTVYLPHKETRLYHELRKRGICVKALNDNIGIIDSFSGSPPTFSKAFFICFLKIILHSYNAVSEIIKNEDPDMVIANSMTLSWIGRLAKKNKKTCICFVRETASAVVGMRLIYYCLNHYFDGVAYLSEFDKNAFHGKAAVQKVIPDTIVKGHYQDVISKEEARRSFAFKSRTFYVLFVGGTNLFPKGFNIIREAMEYLKEYDIELIVAGNAQEAYPCSEKIRYMGIISDMQAVYSAADVLVFPSTAPHQARPAYEAGFLRKPVIITDYQQTREYVKDGKNGLTFKAGDAHMLSCCILRLYKDKRLLNDLGNNNYKYARAQHDPIKCEKKLLAFIEETERYGKR